MEFECNTRTARKHVIRILKAGLVPFLRSSPGIGKSALVRSIAQEFNLHLIDHRLSTSAPEDLTGLPDLKGPKAIFKPFEFLPIEGDEIPEGKNGWLLFFDEFNSGSKAVQAACYKTILDRMTGQYHLHPNCLIVAAGNLVTDRAIVTPMSKAMESRLITLNIKADFDIWLKDVAFPQGFDSRIIGFLSWKPEKLFDFRPNHQEMTFCCPRTWEFMSKLIKDYPVSSDDAELYAGTITSGVAAEFIQFCKIYENIPSIEDIIKSPTSIDIPYDPATKFAIITSLQNKVTNDNLKKIDQYVIRYPDEFKILYYRSLIVQRPEVRTFSNFPDVMVNLSRYFSDD